MSARHLRICWFSGGALVARREYHERLAKSPFYRLLPSDSQANSKVLLDGWHLTDIESRGLADFSSELLGEPVQIVGEDGRFVAGAGDGHVADGN